HFPQPCSSPVRGHDADGGTSRPGRGAGDLAQSPGAVRDNPRAAGGAPGGAASGWWASQTRHRRTRAPRGGIRNPVLTTGQACGDTAGVVRGARNAPIARGVKGPRKPLAPPGAPFAPSLSLPACGEGKGGGGNRDRATRALTETGGGALALHLVANQAARADGLAADPNPTLRGPRCVSEELAVEI